MSVWTRRWPWRPWPTDHGRPRPGPARPAPPAGVPPVLPGPVRSGASGQESRSRAVCVRPAYPTIRIRTSFPESRSRVAEHHGRTPVEVEGARRLSCAPWVRAPTNGRQRRGTRCARYSNRSPPSPSSWTALSTGPAGSRPVPAAGSLATRNGGRIGRSASGRGPLHWLFRVAGPVGTGKACGDGCVRTAP